jgi:hypothetical protein
MPIDPFTAVSAGASLFGSAMSVAQGIKARREQRKAEKAATRALDAAKKTLSVNHLEGVELPLDAYQNEANANTLANRQALDTLSESGQRAAIGGVGRVQAGTVDANERIRESMQRNLLNLDLMKRREDSRIAGELGDISLAEAEGAQVAAMNREQQAASAFTGAIDGLSGAGLTALKNSPLYSDNDSGAE